MASWSLGVRAAISEGGEGGKEGKGQSGAERESKSAGSCYLKD